MRSSRLSGQPRLLAFARARLREVSSRDMVRVSDGLGRRAALDPYRPTSSGACARESTLERIQACGWKGRGGAISRAVSDELVVRVSDAGPGLSFPTSSEAARATSEGQATDSATRGRDFQSLFPSIDEVGWSA